VGISTFEKHEKKIGGFLIAFYVGSAFTMLESNPQPPCQENANLSDFVIAENRTIEVSNLVISAQTIAQNSNVMYKSGSGTELSFGMTGSLNGASSGFQIFSGSTLTVEIGDCSS